LLGGVGIEIGWNLGGYYAKLGYVDTLRSERRFVCPMNERELSESAASASAAEGREACEPEELGFARAEGDVLFLVAGALELDA
jgi:hypothetical protein